MIGSTDCAAEPKSPRRSDSGGDDRLSALPDELIRAILSRLNAQQAAQTCVLATRWRHLWRTVTYFDSDRLSALPDKLIHAILSRLKAQQTAQTCVLSTRWRHLWRSVPRLDIDEWDWYYAWEPPYSDLLRCHHASVLEDLRLHVDYPLPFDQWVRRAVGLDDDASFQFQPCRLKKLHLFNIVEINLTDLATHMSSSRCPALEDVELESCGFFFTGNAKIASLSLNKLSIIGHINDSDDDEVFQLVIEAPALVSLQLGHELDHFVDPHTMPSLVDAMVHMCIYREKSVKPQLRLSILAALSNVTTLHLCDFGVKLLFNEGQEDLPVFKFENLRTLILEECSITDDFLGLRQYLHNSPNLHKLTFSDCKVRPGKETKDRLDSYSKDLKHFKCNNLRVSEIIYNYTHDYVHLLVKFLVAAQRNLPNNKIQLTAPTYRAL